MIPTSLDVAGFAPAEGNLSSQSSSLGYRYQDQGSQWANQDTSFRQVMSSYSRSHEGQADDRTQQEPRQPASKQDTRTNDAASSTNSSADTTRASSSIGRSDEVHKDSEERAANASDAKTAAAGVATGENAAAAPASPSRANLTGFSALQMLLHGGSRAQMAAPGDQTLSPVPRQTGAPSTGTDASGAAAAKSAQPLALLSAVLGQSLASAKSGKAKSDAGKTADAKSTGGSSESAGANVSPAGLGNTALVEQQGTSSAAVHIVDAEQAAKNGIAVAGGSTPESPHLRAAEQNGYAAVTAANNFAFAVRLTGAEAQAKSAHEAANETAAHDVPGLVVQGLHAAAAGGEPDTSAGGDTPGHAGGHHEEQLAGAAMMMAGVEAPAGQTGQASSAQAAQDPTPATATEPEAATGLPQSEPVRNMHLQLTGENNQRVDIRLVEIGGEMRVSVRAGDTKLAETLQDHIPDLAKNLDQQRVRAEIWTPRTESPSQTSGSHTGEQSSRDGDSQGRGQGGQQRQGSGRQQQNQPEWVDEFENYPSRTTNTRITNTRSN